MEYYNTIFVQTLKFIPRQEFKALANAYHKRP